MATIVAPSVIAQAAYNAGFRGPDLIKAIAISLEESIGGNPHAVNQHDPGGSYGLFQINLGSHPNYASQVSNGTIFDPQTNANDAFAIYQAAGNSFRPWSTFTNGTYAANLNIAQNAVSGLNTTDLVNSGQPSICDAPTVIPIPFCPPNSPGGTANSQGGPGNAISSAQDFFTQFGDWLNPLRLVELIGGMALIAIDLLLLIVPDVAKAGVKYAKAAAL